MKDHPGEELVHVDDGDEEAECDEEWIEHLPLDGKVTKEFIKDNGASKL